MRLFASKAARPPASKLFAIGFVFAGKVLPEDEALTNKNIGPHATIYALPEEGAQGPPPSPPQEEGPQGGAGGAEDGGQGGGGSGSEGDGHAAAPRAKVAKPGAGSGRAGGPQGTKAAVAWASDAYEKTLCAAAAVARRPQVKAAVHVSVGEVHGVVNESGGACSWW